MDDKLSRALRSLPRSEARPGFTDAVWRRLEERRAKPRLGAPWQLRLAIAAACLLLLALGTREWWHHHSRQQTVARLAALEHEHRALAAELEALRRQMDQAQPVVFLGGDNELDLVLDLAELQRAGFRPGDFNTDRLPSPGVRPARFEEPRKPTTY